MLITVLSATKEQAVSKAGKPYSYIELAYKGNDGKVSGKKIMPFGESKVVFDALSTAQSGEFFDITLFKNEASGYWDWTAAKKSDGNPTQEAQSAATTVTPGSTKGGKVLGSTYETPEERAKKQVYIVRQSSITAALSYLNSNNTKNATKYGIAEVLQTAKEFEQFVFDTGTPAATQSIIDMEDDIPL